MNKKFAEYRSVIAKDPRASQRIKAMGRLEALANGYDDRQSADGTLYLPAAKIFAEISEKGQTRGERLKAIEHLDAVMRHQSPNNELIDYGIDTLFALAENAPTAKERMYAMHYMNVSTASMEALCSALDPAQGRERIENIFCSLAQLAQTAETAEERIKAIHYCSDIAWQQSDTMQDAAHLLQGIVQQAETKEERILAMEELRDILTQRSKPSFNGSTSYLSPEDINECFDILQESVETGEMPETEELIPALLDVETLIPHVTPQFLIRSGALVFDPTPGKIQQKETQLTTWISGNNSKRSAMKTMGKYADNCLDGATKIAKTIAASFSNTVSETTIPELKASLETTEYYQRMQQKLKVG